MHKGTGAASGAASGAAIGTCVGRTFAGTAARRRQRSRAGGRATSRAGTGVVGIEKTIAAIAGTAAAASAGGVRLALAMSAIGVAAAAVAVVSVGEARQLARHLGGMMTSVIAGGARQAGPAGIGRRGINRRVRSLICNGRALSARLREGYRRAGGIRSTGRSTRRSTRRSTASATTIVATSASGMTNTRGLFVAVFECA